MIFCFQLFILWELFSFIIIVQSFILSFLVESMIILLSSGIPLRSSNCYQHFGLLLGFYSIFLNLHLCHPFRTVLLYSLKVIFFSFCWIFWLAKYWIEICNLQCYDCINSYLPIIRIFIEILKYLKIIFQLFFDHFVKIFSWIVYSIIVDGSST